MIPNTRYKDGSIGMLHTVESERRRGLARLVVVDMAHKLEKAAAAVSASSEALGGRSSDQQGSAGCGTGSGSGCNANGRGSAAADESPFAFVVLDNAASCALLTSLGFQRCDELFVWLGFQKAG